MALVALLAITACAPGVGGNDLQGGVLDPPEPKPEFTLIDTSGQVYDFVAETDDKLTLLYFGYLNCPDICPVHLAQLAEVFDQIPAIARDTEVVFVTVDPERDSPEKIREYLDEFDRRFVGLTGTLDEVVAAQEAADLPVARFIGDGDDYFVDHAGWVMAFGPDGLKHALYPSGTRQSEWLNDLPLLMELTGE